jgi:hypothetical protein
MRTHAIYGVLVPGREEGFCLFDDLHDAEAFAEIVRNHGGLAELSEELLYDHHDTAKMIHDEAVAGARMLSLFQERDVFPDQTGLATRCRSCEHLFDHGTGERAARAVQSEDFSGRL